MTTTEVLDTIRDREGRDALADGKRLLGLFDDYSQGKLRPQSNALRVLIECGGNQRIGQLRDASPLRQKTELHRLVQEMVTEYNMQETSARDICGAIWEAFCGTEVPLNQLAERQPEETAGMPEKRPDETPPECVDDHLNKGEQEQPNLLERYQKLDGPTRRLIRCGIPGMIGDGLAAVYILYLAGEDIPLPWWMGLLFPVFAVWTALNLRAAWAGKRRKVKSQFLAVLCLLGWFLAIWLGLGHAALYTVLWAYLWNVPSRALAVVFGVCACLSGVIAIYGINYPLVDFSMNSTNAQ